MVRKATLVILFFALLLGLSHGVAWVLKPAYMEAIGTFKPARVLFIGSSHTRAGLDERLIEQRLGEPVAKIGLPGATTRDKEALLRFYVEEYGVPEELYYEVGVLMFNEKRFVAGSYQQLYPLVDSPVISDHLRSQDEISDFCLRKFLPPLRYNGAVWPYAVRVLTGATKFARTRTLHGMTDLWEKRIREKFTERELEFSPESLRLLRASLDFAREKGIRTSFVYLPESSLLTKYFDFSRIEAALMALQAEYDVGFIDFRAQFEDEDGLFSDPDHLNAAGREKFSEMVSQEVSPNR